MAHKLFRAFWALIVAMSLAATMPAAALAADDEVFTARPYEVVLDPGQTYTTEVMLWCISFGKPFPAAAAATSSRAAESVVKVLQEIVDKNVLSNTMQARNEISTTTYQAQLAVWKASDGALHDFAGRGTALAEQIHTGSLSQTLKMTPTNAFFSPTFSGTLEVSFGPTVPITDPTAGGAPYVGTSVLSIKNVGAQKVKFSIVPGAQLDSVQGLREQSLVMLPQVKVKLPGTGESLGELVALPLALLLSGIGFVAVGLVVLRTRRRRA